LPRVYYQDSAAARIILSGLFCYESIIRLYYQDSVARTLYCLSRDCCHEDSIIRSMLPRVYYQDSAGRTLLSGLCCKEYVCTSLLSGLFCHEYIIRSLLPGLYYQETVATTLLSGVCCHRLYYQESVATTLLQGVCWHESIIKILHLEILKECSKRPDMSSHAVITSLQVQCVECEKKRCVYAYGSNGTYFRAAFRDLEGMFEETGYEFTCGNNLFASAMRRV
jgi:hypothetical protein